MHFSSKPVHFMGAIYSLNAFCWAMDQICLYPLFFRIFFAAKPGALLAEEKV